jgi:hypothetical protein
MIAFSVEVDERNVLLHLNELPSRLHTALRPVIAKLTEQLLARVHAAEPRRTGQLQRATQAFVDDKQDYIRGRVRVLAISGRGHNVMAAALEYGAHRMVRVRAHQTHIDHIFNRKSARQIAMVDAYTRRANINAYRFLRGPMTSVREQARTELERVIAEQLK